MNACKFYKVKYLDPSPVEWFKQNTDVPDLKQDMQEGSVMFVEKITSRLQVFLWKDDW